MNPSCLEVIVAFSPPLYFLYTFFIVVILTQKRATFEGWALKISRWYYIYVSFFFSLHTFYNIIGRTSEGWALKMSRWYYKFLQRENISVKEKEIGGRGRPRSKPSGGMVSPFFVA